MNLQKIINDPPKYLAKRVKYYISLPEKIKTYKQKLLFF